MKELLSFLSYSLKHLKQSCVLRHWLVFNASLSEAHISCTIIWLTLPLCVLAGLISLHSGFVLKSLLWSLMVIKQFLVLYFSTLSTMSNWDANILASLFNSRRNCSRIVPTHEFFVILLYLVLSTLCNCSIAAFCGGFCPFCQLIAYLLIFFQLVWQDWPFFLPITVFFFPRAVIRDLLLSLNPGVFFFFFFLTVNAVW